MTVFEFKTYEYTPLPTPTSIRVVSFLEPDVSILQPSLGGVPLLQCSLEVIDLNDHPSFEALSYTWGSPFPQDYESDSNSPPNIAREYDRATSKWPIAVDGRLVFVTKNLFDALQHLHPSTANTIRGENGEGEQQHEPVDLRYEPYNKTGLIQAAEEGRFEDVKSFLRRGADVFAQDCFRETALHYAAENGHFAIVRLLVRAGSDVSLLDSTGRTPLMCARMRLRGEHAEVISFLESPAHMRRALEEFSKDDLRPINERRLWVDAICCNQADIPERNAQMAIMSRIYGAASCVVVWLGVEDEHTPHVQEAMKRINAADVFSEGLWYNAAWRYTHSRLRPEMDVDWTSDDSIVSIRQYRALVALLRRTWFQRAWVIQELTLAPEVRIFCGSYEFRWIDFFELLQHRLGKSGHQVLALPYFPLIKYGKGQMGSEAWCLTDIRFRTAHHELERSHLNLLANINKEIVPTWQDRLSLPILLTLSWNFQATEPRDKIFSLLGIAKPHTNTSRVIVADYGMPTEDLYTRIGHLFIEGVPEEVIQDFQTGATEIFEPLEGLSFVQAPFVPSEPPKSVVFKTPETRTPNLPSWVPDFAAPLVTERLWSSRFEAATLAAPPHIHKSEDSRLLSLDGLMVDEITYCENRISEGPIDTGIRYSLLSWLEIATRLPTPYPFAHRCRIDTLWRTLMTDNIWKVEKEDPDIDARQSFKNYICSTLRNYEERNVQVRSRCLKLMEELRPSDGKSALPTLEEIQAWQQAHAHDHEVQHLCHPDSMQKNELRNFDSQFTHHYRSRKLFMTGAGYLGLGPRSAQESDQLWLLAGARTPFVFRPLKDRSMSAKGTPCKRFEFIGEAYVHGTMYGELMQKENVTFERIDLV